ncbi:MAG: hypothetical protein HQL65_14390, partial [Magnetococcales bacterium]|nr:hypothetical protein [Magnetococcales bacterium]
MLNKWMDYVTVLDAAWLLAGMDPDEHYRESTPQPKLVYEIRAKLFKAVGLVFRKEYNEKDKSDFYSREISAESARAWGAEHGLHQWGPAT